MKTEMWLDTNGCSEHFHHFKRDALGEPLKCLHGDDSECDEAEFGWEPRENNND